MLHIKLYTHSKAEEHIYISVKCVCISQAFGSPKSSKLIYNMPFNVCRSRYQGIYSTGDNGLTEKFDLAPKQLHYIVGILELHELVKKQSFSSEKKRSVIHLSRYAYKKRTIIEDLCEYLLLKHIKGTKKLYFNSFKGF